MNTDDSPDLGLHTGEESDTDNVLGDCRLLEATGGVAERRGSRIMKSITAEFSEEIVPKSKKKSPEFGGV